DYGDDNAVELGDDLSGIALEQAGDAAGYLRSCGKRADRKNAGEQSAGKSADAMHSENIERDVVPDFKLEPSASQKADRASDNSDEHALHRQHEARCRGDCA